MYTFFFHNMKKEHKGKIEFLCRQFRSFFYWEKNFVVIICLIYVCKSNNIVAYSFLLKLILLSRFSWKIFLKLLALSCADVVP